MLVSKFFLVWTCWIIFFLDIVVIGGNESDRDSVHVCFVTLCVCDRSGIDRKAVPPQETV